MRLCIVPAAVFALSLAFVGNATAQAKCAEPAIPSCVEAIKPNASDSAINACRFKVQGYVFLMGRYARCLESAADRATQKADDVAKKFEAKCGAKAVKC